MQTEQLRYWRDDQGRVWKGPVSPDDNLHYSVFGGHMTVPPYRRIWTCCRSSPPAADWADEISEAEAAAIIGPEYLSPIEWPEPAKIRHVLADPSEFIIH